MRSITKVLVAAAASAAVVVSLSGTAGAAGRHRVDTHGFGTYTASGPGAVVATGTATGAPFDGTFVATLAADDGALPEPGACEPGTATLRLEGSRDRFLELSSNGEVCGDFTSPTWVVTHVFTGRYTVTASSQRKLTGTDGFYEVRLANDGRASAFAIDT